MPENGDDELAELRKRKLLEMQSQQSQMAQVQEQQQAMESQKQAILIGIMTPDARERLGRVKTAYPEIVAEIERELVMLASSGRLGQKIDDETMKNLLAKMMPKKHDIKIIRRGRDSHH
jgi:programmed cell death protein 5